MRLSALGPSWKSGSTSRITKYSFKPGIDPRRDPLAEGIIEDRIDHRRVDAQLGSELRG